VAGFEIVNEILLEALVAGGGLGFLIRRELVEVLGEEDLVVGVVEEDGVELLEILGFEEGEVVGDDGFEGAGFLGEDFEGFFAVGDGIVDVAPGDGEDEELAGLLGFDAGLPAL
jgi:hypothetical protein